MSNSSSKVKEPNLRHPVATGISLVCGRKAAVFVSVVLSLFQSALLAPVALLVNRIFDQRITSGDTSGLIFDCAAIVGLSLANGLLHLTNRRVVLDIVKHSIARLRLSMVSSLLQHPHVLMSRSDRDSLQASIVQDTSRADAFLSSFLGQFLPSALASVGLLAVALYIHPLLSLVAVGAGMASAGIVWVMHKPFTRAVRAYHADFARFSNRIAFLLHSSELVHLSAAEKVEQKRQQHTIEQLRSSLTKAAWLSTVQVVCQREVMLIGSSAVLLAGSFMAVSGSLTLGGLLSFYAAIGLLSTHARNAISAVPQMVEGQESLRTLGKILEGSTLPASDGPAEDGSVVVPQVLDAIRSIEFKEVSFGYGEELLLDKLSFTCKAGEVVHIKGPSGSGKTTLTYLLLGLLEPNSGTVLVNGVPLKDIDKFWYRQRTGTASQDQMLFHGTVRENITYGLEHWSEEALAQACALSYTDLFLSALPSGLDTMVGDRGLSLSGGQRQRLSIARALLRNPDVLVLDEPHNHLPADMAQEIIAACIESNRIVVVIDHAADAEPPHSSKDLGLPSDPSRNPQLAIVSSHWQDWKPSDSTKVSPDPSSLL